jgi:copper oxidase (laccase) domain-containing protein
VARGPLSRYLDLAAVNEAQLRAAGLGAVEILRHCTICERGSGGAFRFHSFRRDGTPGRQRAQIRRELPP